MSEYQFYEFAAVDQPLNREETPYPWDVSTRATVTRRRWKNEYNWGDFKGSPEKMMEYYDAHVYLANWGSFCLMLAFPAGSIPDAILEACRADDGFWCSQSHGRIILGWERINDEPWDDWVDGEGLLDQLLPIRDEILRGDHRALYLGWLAFQSWFDCDDDDDLEDEILFEPPVPPGLDRLTAAQESLVGLLEIDQDLLDAAADLDVPQGNQEKFLHEKLTGMPHDKAIELLAAVAEGKSTEVMAKLNRMKTGEQPLAEHGPRTIGQLWTLANKIQAERLDIERREREARQRAKEKKKRQHLEKVLLAAEEQWRKADALGAEGKAKAYDQCARIVKELSQAYAQAGKDAEFQDRLAAFRMAFKRRPALIRRLEKL